MMGYMAVARLIERILDCHESARAPICATRAPI